jgi:transposase
VRCECSERNKFSEMAGKIKFSGKVKMEVTPQFSVENSNLKEALDSLDHWSCN